MRSRRSVSVFGAIIKNLSYASAASFVLLTARRRLAQVENKSGSSGSMLTALRNPSSAVGMRFS